jgi:protein disulfide-isomerase
MKKAILFFIISYTLSLAQLKAQVKKAAKKSVVTAPTKSQKIEEQKIELEWFTNVFKADSISKKSQKPLFGFFTGSDWCGWCHKLQREVFQKEAFKKWAKENVILLELDFPRKTTLPTELQQQNAGLQQAFQVQGFPTIWMFYIEKDGAGKNNKLNSLGSLGYPSNAIVGKEEIAFLENANSIIAKDKKVK